MSPPEQQDIQVQEDLHFQRRNWLIQRVSWVVIALVLAASLLGAFGRGPLSSAAATSTGATIHAEYDRIARFAARTSIGLSVTSPGTGGTVVVRVSRHFLENVEIQGILPQPERVYAGERDVAYEFAIGDDRRARVVFTLLPRAIGSQEVSVSVEGGEGIRFRQFVLP
jgi:hypothetical protein